MSMGAADRQRALFELSGRALDGATPDELTSEAVRSFGSALGEETARSLASQIASIAEDPLRELASDPLDVATLELVRAAFRRVQAGLKEVEQRRELLDHSSDGICVIDREGFYVDMNAPGREMLGYTMEELRRLRIFDLVLPTEAPVDIPALESGQPILRRRHIRRKDGSLLLAEIGSRLLPDGGILGVFRDVAEQVRRERELRESTERLGQALRAARAGAWEWNIRTNEAYGSEEAYRLLGVEPGAMAYGAWLDRVHPDDRQRAEITVERCVRDCIDLDIEVRVVTGEGQARWLRDVGKLETDTEGRPVRMYGILIDIDESKRAELARAKAEAQLEQARRMEAIGRLAGGIAHDFNNLLTVILTASDMIVGRMAEEEPNAAHIDAIREAATRGAAVTRQLLALSRTQPVMRRPLDLNAQIRRMAPMLRRLLGEDIVIEMALAPDLPAVSMDPGQLDQVVLNLACNGRDAMPLGGELTFTTSAGEIEGRPYAALAVGDTGSGMDEETRARVFEPFFTTKPAGKGTGLGLATVYGIIAQNHGRIDVESSTDGGTCFRAWLPATDEAAIADAREEPRVPPGDGARVLLVEDERAVRRLVRRVLEAAGHRVVEAAGAEEALSLARTSGESFDVLLTDVVMPHMSGPELATRLREELPDVRVLFMSGYVDDALARHAFADDIALISKPFTPAELLEHVDRVLQR